MFTKHIAMFRNDLRYWQKQGLDLDELARQAQLPTSQLSQEQTRLEVRSICRLFEAAQTSLNDPGMGFRIGQQVLLPDLSPLGDVLHYYRDGWQALKALETYWPLLTEAQTISLHRAGQDEIAIRCNAVDGIQVHRMQTHAILSGFVRLADVMFGVQDGETTRLELSADTPLTDLFSALVKVPVRGDCQQDQVVIPSHCLDTLNPNHDDDRYQQGLSQCDKALAALRDEHFVAGIRNTLRQQLPNGEIDQKTLASALNISVRNLQRRLSSHNTCFRDLLDQVRAEQAELLVRIGEESLNNIARQMGYEDPTSFHKAFKRWQGMPPGEYRARFQQEKPGLTAKHMAELNREVS